MTLLPKLAALATAAALALPTVASAHTYQSHTHTPSPAQTVTIQIACFRGPWREVIIDRAEVSFIDNLVAYGYSLGEAEAIGNRVCRDQQGVDNGAYLADLLRTILRTQPPR